MPASLPGALDATNKTGNPSAGPLVIFDLLSGPKGSPKDTDQAGNASTGGLSTGIGYGAVFIGPTAPASIQAAGFDDDEIPGATKPDGTAAGNATLMYIGGGKSDAAGVSAPYTAGYGLGVAGNGGTRDAGAGPAFTGFNTKMVTAAATVANAALIETGYNNRTGVSLTTGVSTFGVNSSASAAPAMANPVEGEADIPEPRHPGAEPFPEQLPAPEPEPGQQIA